MKNTKKRVAAELKLKELNIQFYKEQSSEAIYKMVEVKGYFWNSQEGRWERNEINDKYGVSRKDYVRVRVLAEPEYVVTAVRAAIDGLESGGFVVVEQSAPYQATNPKYKGQTALRVYITAVKYNGAN